MPLATVLLKRQDEARRYWTRPDGAPSTAFGRSIAITGPSGGHARRAGGLAVTNDRCVQGTVKPPFAFLRLGQTDRSRRLRERFVGSDPPLVCAVLQDIRVVETWHRIAGNAGRRKCASVDK